MGILMQFEGRSAVGHFCWHDKAGNAPEVTDSTNGLVFPDLEEGGELFQNNLIMPEGCPFLSRHFPPCAVVRPTQTQGVATAALQALTAMGLFIGQSKAFFNYMRGLAADADAARRES